MPGVRLRKGLEEERNTKMKLSRVVRNSYKITFCAILIFRFDSCVCKFHSNKCLKVNLYYNTI